MLHRLTIRSTFVAAFLIFAFSASITACSSPTEHNAAITVLSDGLRKVTAVAHNSNCEMTVQVRYKLSRNGKAVIRSTKASFVADKGFALPQFHFTFHRPGIAAAIGHFSTRQVEGNHIATHGTGWISIQPGTGYAIFEGREYVTASLWAMNAITDTAYRVLKIRFVLAADAA